MGTFNQGSHETRAQFDFRQLQEELSGAISGRMYRFLTPEMVEALKPGARAEKREAYYSSLLIHLLTNRRYAAAYERAWTVLEDYERRAEQALEHVNADLDALTEQIALMRANAGRLADGTHVYPDVNGVIRRENGSAVSALEAEAIVWPKNPTAFEDINAALTRQIELQSASREIEIFQVDTLGRAREQLDNREGPPSLEELVAFEGALAAAAPPALSETEAPYTPNQAPRPTAFIVPDL